MRVLLIAKKTAFVFELTLYLTFEGEQVTWVPSGGAARGLAATSTFDVVIVHSDDLATDGTDDVGRMEAALNGTPILALYGARRPEASRAAALPTGVDMMFGPSVTNKRVLARLRAIIRRVRGLSEPILRAGIVQLDCAAQEVEVSGVVLELRSREFDLLHLLMTCTDSLLTKGDVLAQLYGEADEPSPKIVDVLVCRLRSKLAQAGAPELISTVYGCGYTIRGVTKATNLHLCPTSPSRLLSI